VAHYRVCWRPFEIFVVYENLKFLKRSIVLLDVILLVLLLDLKYNCCFSDRAS